MKNIIKNLFLTDNSTQLINAIYYIAQVIYCRYNRAVWLVTDVARFLVVWKLLMPCEQKQTWNPKKIIFKKFLCRKTKQNTEMGEEEHSDSEWYYPEEQETKEERLSPWWAFCQSWIKCRYFVPVVFIFVIKLTTY